MSLFKDDVLLQDDETAVFNKTKHVRNAISQGWEVGQLVRQPSALGSRFKKVEDFLLVITNRELLIGGGQMLQHLYGLNKITCPDADAERRLPLRNVFVLSIEEFENLTSCIKSGAVNLSELLKKAAKANESGLGTNSRLFISDFLKESPEDWPQCQLLAQAREDTSRRLEAIIGR
jgi:hypothetical protein